MYRRRVCRSKTKKIQKWHENLNIQKDAFWSTKIEDLGNYRLRVSLKRETCDIIHIWGDIKTFLFYCFRNYLDQHIPELDKLFFSELIRPYRLRN
jgi:hypothetical protein